MKAGDFEGTVAGAQLAEMGMPPDLAPAVMLAVLWASLANTVPAAFWALAFLLLPSHAQHLDAVLLELQEAQDAQGIVRVSKSPTSQVSCMIAGSVYDIYLRICA